MTLDDIELEDEPWIEICGVAGLENTGAVCARSDMGDGDVADASKNAEQLPASAAPVRRTDSLEEHVVDDDVIGGKRHLDPLGSHFGGVHDHAVRGAADDVVAERDIFGHAPGARPTLRPP